MGRRVFITAAEASGDQHAAELVRSLGELDPTLTFEGIGGPKMAAAGVHLHAETIRNAAMGWRGALRAWEASGWIRKVVRCYREQRPDLQISVDSSAINLPLARKAKRFGIPVLYYIAPQLWASREWRMWKLRAWIDRLAVIFPFEEPYFRSHGVNATFVGHPLFDELPQRRGDAASPAGSAARFPAAPPVIGLVPGSRRSEVSANLPHQIDVAGHIRNAFPGARFLVPTTDATHALVRSLIGDFPAEIRQNGFDALIPQCDLCITKSGTSTLQIAAWSVPMVVVYRLNPLIWHLAARWLIKTPKIAMVNILAGNMELVPEFIPWYGSNEPVARCALNLLEHPEKLADQRRRLVELVATLDRPGASMNAARIALEMMNPVPGAMQAGSPGTGTLNSAGAGS